MAKSTRPRLNRHVHLVLDDDLIAYVDRAAAAQNIKRSEVIRRCIAAACERETRGAATDPYIRLEQFKQDLLTERVARSATETRCEALSRRLMSIARRRRPIDVEAVEERLKVSSQAAFSPQQAADILGTSRYAVHAMLRNGKLKSTGVRKQRRVTRDHIRAFLRNEIAD